MPSAHSKGLSSCFPLPDEIEPGDEQQVSGIKRVAGDKGISPGNGKRRQGCKKQHGKQQAAVIGNGHQPAPKTAMFPLSDYHLWLHLVILFP